MMIAPPASSPVLNASPNSSHPASTPVAGISNTFSRDADEVRAWRGVTRAAHELVGTMPFVGWEAGDGVLAAVEAGGERLGPLTVWIS